MLLCPGKRHNRYLSVLSSLFITQVVESIAGALRSTSARAAPQTGKVAVLGDPRVARALVERGHAVVHVADKRGSLRKLTGDRVYARPAALPFHEGRLHALVGFGLGQRDDWKAHLSEWARVVADGGVIVLVDRAPPTELTRRALVGGLAELEQRHAGRTVVTSGLVTKL